MTPSRVALFVALALPMAAQMPPQTPSETLTVDYIEVPVNVVDRGGNPVRNLTKGNFELYDGKSLVSVTSFDTIDFTSPESMRLAANRPSAHRAFLLVFDLGYSSPNGLQRAREAARTFVDKSVQRGDLVAVATIDHLQGYKILSTFTTDRAATLLAVQDPRRFRSADPLQLSAEGGFSKAQLDEDRAVHPGALDELVYQRRAAVAGMNDADADDIGRQEVHNQIDWLAELAASLRNIRGRKQIVLLSEGFNPRLIQGRTAKDHNQENEEAAMIISGSWHLFDTARQLDMDRRYGSTSSLTTLEILRQSFTGSDVTLNAIDIQGVRTEADTSRGELTPSSDGLSLLANPTGGTVFRNSNDLSTDFGRMLHQQEYVYVLGFQRAVKNPGRLHVLKVKLVGGPAGARAVYRQGFFEGGTRYTPTERTLNAADVITRDIPQEGVHLASMAVPFPSTGDSAPVATIVEISGADLLKSAKENDIAAELFMYAFDESGSVRDRVYHRFALDVARDGDRLRANGVKFIATLLLPPGRYAVKTLVRVPGDDRLGFSRADVDVSKPGAVALLQPFLLDDPQSWVLVKSARPGTEPPYPFHVNGEPFIPSVAGRVPTAGVRKIAVFVSNAKPEELTWEMSPPATLLATIKGADATKLVLQLDPAFANAAKFGVTVRKLNEVMTASTPLAIK